MRINSINVRLICLLAVVLLIILGTLGNPMSSSTQSDNTPPSCAMTGVDAGPPVTLNITAQDTGSGIAAIHVRSAENCTVEFCLECACPCTTDPISITAKKIDSTKKAFVELEIIDCAGNRTVCDPIITTLQIPDSGDPGTSPRKVVQTFTDVPRQESFITVQNGTPGLRKLLIKVNRRKYDLLRLKREELIIVDVSFLMTEEENAVTFTGSGKPGANALVVISDGSIGAHLHSIAASQIQAASDVELEFLKPNNSVITPPLRVGKSTNGDGEPRANSTQSLKVKITPASEVTNVTLSVSPTTDQTGKVILTNQTTNIAEGVINFNVAGTKASGKTGDVSVIAKHTPSGCQTNLPVSVLVPAKISNKRELNRPLLIQNFSLNITTIPPANTDLFQMVTFYGKILPIEVIDQFGKPIGDLYAGAKIEEDISLALPRIDLNVTLGVDSKFPDHAGLAIPREGFPNGITADPAIAGNWINAPKIPPPRNQDFPLNVINIYVDGFRLENTITNRLIRFDAQGNFTIIWP